MSKINALRKLIREEMTQALEEVLPKVVSMLNEQKAGSQYKDTLKKQVENKIPGTLNSKAPVVKAPMIRGGNILNTMLAETAQSMTHRDTTYLQNTEVDGYSAVQNYDYESDSATDVNDMLSKSVPSSAHEMVQINAVPDFNNLMEKMINKGVM